MVDGLQVVRPWLLGTHWWSRVAPGIPADGIPILTRLCTVFGGKERPQEQARNLSGSVYSAVCPNSKIHGSVSTTRQRTKGHHSDFIRGLYICRSVLLHIETTRREETVLIFHGNRGSICLTLLFSCWATQASEGYDLKDKHVLNLSSSSEGYRIVYFYMAKSIIHHPVPTLLSKRISEK